MSSSPFFFEDDLVVVDEFTFDETNFLAAELKALSMLLGTTPPAIATPKTSLVQFSDKITTLIGQFQHLTKTPKNIIWTADDQAVLDLYNRLLIHKQRLDAIINANGRPPPPPPPPPPLIVPNNPQPDTTLQEQSKQDEEILRLKQQLAKVSDENQKLKIDFETERNLNKDNNENITQLTQQITLLTGQNEGPTRLFPVINDIDTDFVSPSNTNNNEITTTGSLEDGNNLTDDDKPELKDDQMSEDEPPSGAHAWHFLEQPNGKFKTPRAVDYEQLKTNYIETLLTEIDRLSLLGQEYEARIKSFGRFEAEMTAQVTTLQGEKTYFEILTQLKDQELKDLLLKCDQWEKYANQQETEVLELTTILIEQHKTNFGRLNTNTTTLLDADGDDDDKEATEAIEVEEITNPSLNETTTVQESTTTDSNPEPVDEIQLESVSVDNNLATPSTPSITTTTSISPIHSGDNNNNNINNDDALEIEKHKQIAATAKEIAELSKAMLLETQIQLDTVQTELADTKNQLEIERELTEDLNRQLTAESEDRRRIVVELGEEREHRRIFKTKMDTAQAQVLKLLQENSVQVGEIATLQDKIEHCLLNHGVQHPDLE